MSDERQESELVPPWLQTPVRLTSFTMNTEILFISTGDQQLPDSLNSHLNELNSCQGVGLLKAVNVLSGSSVDRTL